MAIFSELGSQILHYVGVFFSATWWFWIFLISVPLARSSWLAWRQQAYKKKQKNLLYEIRIPREIMRSPKAMEQLFSAVHQMQNAPGNFKEKYLDGEVGRKFSFEMVSFSGEIHFYVRFYYKYVGLIQGAFFSAYPDVELVEVDDYVNRMPKTYADWEAAGFDIWGTELTLKKPAMYPIKTYMDFETMVEESQFDPISVFIEILNKIKPQEFVGIQYVIDPLDSKWAKEFEPELDKLKAPKKTETTDAGTYPMMIMKSPGETDVIKAVERKLSKPAFKAMVRFFYASPRPSFYDSFARRTITSTFNQYAANDLNGFSANVKVAPMSQIWYFPYLFSNLRNKLKKQRNWNNYIARAFPPKTVMGKFFSSHILSWNWLSKTIVLTADELATLFHPPTHIVLTAPSIERVTSKKGGPPAGLAIYGEEKEIEKFTNGQ